MFGNDEQIKRILEQNLKLAENMKSMQEDIRFLFKAIELSSLASQTQKELLVGIIKNVGVDAETIVKVAKIEKLFNSLSEEMKAKNK